MTAGLIGGNGEVGTELSFLLRQRGRSVTPICRNALGSAYLSHHGFECELGDVTDDTVANNLLPTFDGVVIAAFAPPISRRGFHPQGARRDNEAIVENAVRNVSADVPVIYFSSVIAHGREIGKSPLDWYYREKRNAETVFLEACQEHGQPGYVLRLGHVHGFLQDRSRSLTQQVQGQREVSIPIDPTTASNVLHTVSLAEAVDRCLDGAIEPGTYTLTNRPQWEWSRVLTHYADGELRIRYEPEETGLLSRVPVDPDPDVVAQAKDLTTLVLSSVPDSVSGVLYNRFLQSTAGSEIAALDRIPRIDLEVFTYDQKAPGPYLPGQTKTDELLSEMVDPVDES